jgi:hypothetical protein
MDTGTAITVKYWVSTDQPHNFLDLEGIDDFRRELANDYVSFVKGRPAGAGGVTHLFVELISTLSLSHVRQLILDGIAYDLIKHGSEAFVLRPFLAAYRKLQERNKAREFLDIGELKIQFQDSLLIIHEISSDSLVAELRTILLTLAKNYEHLALKSGESPFAIHIPVFEDPDVDRPCRFRVIGDIDETIRSSGPEDYIKFWGMEYAFERDLRVYDVERQLLLDEEFYTLDRYWDVILDRSRQRREERLARYSGLPRTARCRVSWQSGNRTKSF